MYIVVSIGNTDNRLTQQEWSDFVEEVGDAINKEGTIHFFGGAPNWEKWQNVAWIVDAGEGWGVLQGYLVEIRKKYRQDSAFVMIGEGRFI